jgi:hypothetical protein
MILLGVNIYAPKGDAAQRQENCLKSLRALKNVCLVNLQFKTGAIEAEGFETLSDLEGDSLKVTGKKGAQKPIISEVFDVLARQARERGCSYFGYLNSDILVSSAAIDYAIKRGRQAYLFSRMDFDKETDRRLGMLLAGIDFFIVETRWWIDNNWRFRPYIAGEPVWDNVYAAILLCHANAILLNRDPYILHERHSQAWVKSPFAQYTRLLSALDAYYFSLWVKYFERVSELRSRNASEQEEVALQEDIFRWSPSRSERVIQACRNLKARVRYLALSAVEH